MNLEVLLHEQHSRSSHSVPLMSKISCSSSFIHGVQSSLQTSGIPSLGSIQCPGRFCSSLPSLGSKHKCLLMVSFCCKISVCCLLLTTLSSQLIFFTISHLLFTSYTPKEALPTAVSKEAIGILNRIHVCLQCGSVQTL